MNPFTYHTHSTYCDGKNSLSEIAAEASRLGFDSLGLACHSYVAFDSVGCISPDHTEDFKKEIKELAKLYAPRGMDIFLGIEQDALSEPLSSKNDYDYVIGSMHYLTMGSDHVTIDSLKSFHASLEKYFGGDAIAMSLEYYKCMEGLYSLTQCDIVGHFDIVTKFNEGQVLFNERDPIYERTAQSAIEKLAEKDLIFEINTGAIPRGYRSEPYPSKRLLSMIREVGGKVTFSSDCHDIKYLAYGFEIAKKIAKESGFDYMMKLKRDSDGCHFYPEEIDL